MPPPTITPGDAGSIAAFLSRRSRARDRRRRPIAVSDEPLTLFYPADSVSPAALTFTFRERGQVFYVVRLMNFAPPEPPPAPPPAVSAPARGDGPAPVLAFRRPTLVRSLILDCSSVGNSSVTSVIPLDYVVTLATLVGNSTDARVSIQLGWTRLAASNADFEDGDQGLYTPNPRDSLHVSLSSPVTLTVRSLSSGTARFIRARLAANPSVGATLTCYFMLEPRFVVEAEDAGGALG